MCIFSRRKWRLLQSANEDTSDRCNTSGTMKRKIVSTETVSIMCPHNYSYHHIITLTALNSNQLVLISL